jgi:hypothetical protein
MTDKLTQRMIKANVAMSAPDLAVKGDIMDVMMQIESHIAASDKARMELFDDDAHATTERYLTVDQHILRVDVRQAQAIPGPNGLELNILLYDCEAQCTCQLVGLSNGVAEFEIIEL